MKTIMKFYFISVVMPILMILSSCDREKPTKASSTGSPSEIIVVSEDNLWKTSLGDTVRNYFSSERVGLPQPEPLYKIVQIKLSEFNRLFETHRNVLALAIDSSLSDAKFEIAYNVWARPQRVVKITAPSIELLKSSFGEHKREIYNLYENADIERIQSLYSKNSNIKAIESIREKFNISIKIPADYYVAVEKDNFIWLRKEASSLSQGILIYSYPYTDTIAFNIKKIISVRNQFTQIYVPGPSDSSYMIVAEDFLEPITRIIELKKQLAVETRGLWDVKGDFMGGPFINYTLVDQKNNMVIALDGYVYAPNENKTGLLKEVQAMLLSFEFLEK